MKNKPNKQVLWLFGIITIFCLAMAGASHILEIKKEKEWQDKHRVTIIMQVAEKDEKYAAEILQLVIKRLEKMKMTNVAASAAANVITITVGGVTEKERLSQFVASRAKCDIRAINNNDIGMDFGENGSRYYNIRTKKNVSNDEILKFLKVVMPAENLAFSASVNKTKTGYEIPVSITPHSKASEFNRYLSDHNGEYLLYFVDDKLLATQEITDTTVQPVIPMPRSDGIDKNAQEEHRVRTIAQAVQLLYPYPADVTLQSITNN